MNVEPWIIYFLGTVGVGLINAIVTIIIATRPGSPGGKKITMDELCLILTQFGDDLGAALSHPLIIEWLADNNLSIDQAKGLLGAVCASSNGGDPELFLI
jgi:hypothetical protein